MTGAKSQDKSSRAAWIWARAAHDLRQPVQALLLQLPALDRPSQTERRRAAGQIEAALLSLRDMLETLALLARVEAGLQDVTLQIFQLEEALARVFKPAAANAWARDVRFPSSGTRVLVRSHPTLLALAVRSLLLNAVALGGDGEISAACRRRGDDIVLEVNFNGGPLEAGRDKSAFVMPAGTAGTAAGGGEQQVGELGLGLDLLERLCGHLGHVLEASGREGTAKTLAIVVPVAAKR